MRRSLLWVTIVTLVVSVALFAGGYAVRGWQDRVAIREEAHRADSVLQAVSVRFARERDSLTLLRDREVTKAAAAEAIALQKRQVSARLRLQADSLTAALAMQTTAADSLPIVVQQRDGLRLAYDTLSQAADSLTSAIGSLRTTVQIQDSLHALSLGVAAAREAALRSLNDRLRLELAHAQNRGKFLGLVRIPDWSKFAAGAVAGYLLKP